MSEQQFQLTSDAFVITPGGEVVIDNSQLAEALRVAQEVSVQDVTSGTGRHAGVSLVVRIGPER